MKHYRLATFVLLAAAALVLAACGTNNTNYVGNRKPLAESAFIELPLGSIGADGWLHEMLLRQSNGATGHLDELYPEVMGPRNGWLGGDGDQWERGPYWIDGLLPLGYILHDQTLIDKATPWIEWILSSQRPDGQFGPSKDYPHERGLQRDNCEDWWPRMVVLKILMQHYSATGDERVIDLMTNYFRYQLNTLDSKPLDNWTFWARYRGGDNLMAVYWLYNITGDKFLLNLGRKIYAQTEPYTRHFLERDRLSRLGTIHCVNLAQGLKTPLVYSQFDRDPKYMQATQYALDDIRHFHGVPTGVFTGDEAIHGTDPTQGTELCTVVEYMFTMETMYRLTGNLRFADLLEKIAYNALPAQTSDDYMTRQYFQQANQIRCARVLNNFDCDHGLDNCFGLLNGYPCCTSNMHQGWPKFTQNTWYATPDGGLAAVQYAPTHVDAKVAGGVNVRFVEETKYPFETVVNITCAAIDSPTVFPLVLRVPSWSAGTELTVCGERVPIAPDKNGLVRIDRKWSEGDSISIAFTPEIRLSVWHENARAVERGPLVYAYAIPSEKKRVENTLDPDSQGPWYWEYQPKGPWNYALVHVARTRLHERYTVDESGLEGDIVFPWNEENAPVAIEAKAVRALKWGEYNGMAGPLPYSIGYGFKTSSEEETIRLLPYGCTVLRITEFPMKGPHSADNYE
ncbi:MAG: glycoside hydrolase family 127 protein [Bacteroidales bacterium]|nr:glycoside hydrolase family 127 protein [Bacteroidales bacterium]